MTASVIPVEQCAFIMPREIKFSVADPDQECNLAGSAKFIICSDENNKELIPLELTFMQFGMFALLEYYSRSPFDGIAKNKIPGKSQEYGYMEAGKFKIDITDTLDSVFSKGNGPKGKRVRPRAWLKECFRHFIERDKDSIEYSGELCVLNPAVKTNTCEFYQSLKLPSTDKLKSQLKDKLNAEKLKKSGKVKLDAAEKETAETVEKSESRRIIFLKRRLDEIFAVTADDHSAGNEGGRSNTTPTPTPAPRKSAVGASAASTPPEKGSSTSGRRKTKKTQPRRHTTGR